ncbi:MAG: hypothetical protein WD069_08370 [Planctomycetales bacterium]
MLSAPTTRFDRWQEAWADRLNPMLVREMRRSLKSRQFLAAFGLALLAAWLVSAWGLARLGGSGEVLEPGRDFFYGYHLVLDACLFFPVPFGVFRSMSAEFREESFEVLAITTLRAERIVLGKLQCGLAQMGIYLSALAPFLCMTFLMGGVGVGTVLCCLLASFAGSLLLCLMAGMLGALAKRPAWETVNSVLLVLAAMFVFGMSRGVSEEVIRSGMGIGMGGVMGYLACTGAILLFGGAIMLAVTIDQFHPTVSYPHLSEHMSEEYRRTLLYKRLDPEYRNSTNTHARGG